jgi:muconate cycloisomerase
MGATSPEATSIPRRTFVDAAPAYDEIAERLVQVLVFGGEAQRPRPFAPRSVIGLVWGNNFAKCAVETALLDAWGKRIGLPMSELVAGACGIVTFR